MAIIRENSLKAEETKSGYDGTEQDVDIFLQTDDDTYPGKLPWKESSHAKRAAAEAVEAAPVQKSVREEPVDEEQNRLDAIFGEGDFEEEKGPLNDRQNMLEDKEEVAHYDSSNSIENETNEIGTQRGNLIEEENEAKLQEIFKEFGDEQDNAPDKLNAEKYIKDEDESLSAHDEFQLENRDNLENRTIIERDAAQIDRVEEKLTSAASEIDGKDTISKIDGGELGDINSAASKIETGEVLRVDISDDDIHELNELRESLKEELSAPPKEESIKPPPAKHTPFEDVKNDPQAESIEIPDMERASGENAPEPFEFTSTSVEAGEPKEEKSVEGDVKDKPKNAEPSDETDNRKKRKYLWIASAVASIMIAVSAIGYYYLSDLFTAKPQSEIDSNKRFISAIADKFGAGKEKSKPVKKLKVKEVSATASTSGETASKKVEPELVNAAADEPAPTAAPQPKPEASKIIIIEKPKAQRQAAVPKPQAKIAPAPKRIVPAKRLAPAPKSSIASTASRRASAQPEEQSQVADGVFTVQVYSTPSREVAEQILNRLIRRNVAGAYISKQNVREVTYYRIRFGKYSSLGQAREAATRAGYPQSWIDRIK